MLNDEFMQDLLWYYEVLEKRNTPLTRLEKNELNPNGKVLVYSLGAKKYLEENYKIQVLERYRNVVLYQLGGKKDSPYP